MAFLISSGKAKSVRVNADRLRFAYLNDQDDPILTAKHHESLDAKGKYQILHIKSGKVYNSLKAFCHETGVSYKRAKKYLNGEDINLLGNDFTTLNN